MTTASGATPGTNRRAALWGLGLFVAACAALYAGWKLYWFLLDDAYIAFRYISNRRLGYGYTWNAPPFLPVEGYTSFSWIVLLDLIWSWLGIDPPHRANVVSLLCSMGTLALTTVACWQLARSHHVERWFPWLAFWVLLGTVSNRSFLVWSSSGLEAALFNLLLQCWIFGCFVLPSAPARWLPWFTLASAAVCLTRPDGLLFLAATLVVVGLCMLTQPLSARAALVRTLPLSLVAMHLLWRHHVYTAWLPNTYYAKVVKPWPEAGMRYLLAFGLEYAMYFALPIVLLGALAALRSLLRALQAQPQDRVRTLGASAIRAAGVLTPIAHIAYYALIAGGDHFEFRILSYLVPLIMLAVMHGALSVSRQPWLIAGVTGAFIVLGSLIPWTHWQRTHNLNERHLMLFAPIADGLPLVLQPIGQLFDEQEAWLIPRGVGVRHQEHKAFWGRMLSRCPTRHRGERSKYGGPNPVHVRCSAGVAGWTMPHLHIIDVCGLNDYVVARSRRIRKGRVSDRYLAHEREPPIGYVEAFRPNVELRSGRQFVVPRQPPLSDDDVRAIEQKYRALVTR